MVVDRQESEFRQSNGVMSIQDRYFRRLMEEHMTATTTTTTSSTTRKNLNPKVRQEVYGKIMVSSPSYFGMEYLVILVCLTASLLILPLILPPLPPPPFMLLSLPICILGLLMILAFSSSTGRPAVKANNNYRYM